MNVAYQHLIETWVDRLRQEIPNVSAVILKGSYARGEPGPHSDLDFDVLVDREPCEEYRAWFEETDAGNLRHVSVAVQDLGSWMTDVREPAYWAYGLAAAETTRLIWVRDEMLRAQLDHPARLMPPGEPELEDFIEAFGKMTNAWSQRNDLAIRLAGHKLGLLCPGLLRPMNPDVQPSNRRAAMLAALNFPVAPEGYREDLLLCLGHSGRASTLQDIHNAGRRLTFGIIAMVHAQAEVFEGLLPDDLHRYLLDGTLERYIRQIADAGNES
jgi:phosphoribosyl-AMP cyclohydrolase